MPEDSAEVSPSFFKKVFSSFKPHSKEVATPTEAKIKSIIQHAEESIDRIRTQKGYKSEPRLPNKRSGMCGLYSDVVTYLSRLEGLDSHIFQVKTIHERLVYNHLFHDPDQHVFSTVSGPDGQMFLVDLSVGQFLEGERSNQVNNTLIQQLLENGYAPLTDRAIQEYLLFTNPNMAPNSIEHLEKVRVSDLLNSKRVPEEGYDRSDEDLRQFV